MEHKVVYPRLGELWVTLEDFSVFTFKPDTNGYVLDSVKTSETIAYECWRSNLLARGDELVVIDGIEVAAMSPEEVQRLVTPEAQEKVIGVFRFPRFSPSPSRQGVVRIDASNHCTKLEGPMEVQASRRNVFTLGRKKWLSRYVRG